MHEFNELYTMYSKEIYKYFLYQVTDTHLAEELVQETFFQAFKSIGNFQERSSLKTWLYGIARNVYLKNLRNKDKFQRVNIYEIDIESKEDTPQAIYEKKEKLKDIYMKINNLEEPYRQVLILRAINNLTFKEIGIVLKKNENWARVTFHRAKGKLGRENMDG